MKDGERLVVRLHATLAGDPPEIVRAAYLSEAGGPTLILSEAVDIRPMVEEFEQVLTVDEIVAAAEARLAPRFDRLEQGLPGDLVGERMPATVRDLLGAGYSRSVPAGTAALSVSTGRSAGGYGAAVAVPVPNTNGWMLRALPVKGNWTGGSNIVLRVSVGPNAQTLSTRAEVRRYRGGALLQDGMWALGGQGILVPAGSRPYLQLADLNSNPSRSWQYWAQLVPLGALTDAPWPAS